MDKATVENTPVGERTWYVGIRAKIAAVVALGFILTFISILTMNFLSARQTADRLGDRTSVVISHLIGAQMGPSIRFKDVARIESAYATAAEQLGESLTAVRVVHVDGTVLSELMGPDYDDSIEPLIDAAVTETLASSASWGDKVNAHHVFTVPVTTVDGETLLGVLVTVWNYNNVAHMLTEGIVDTTIVLGLMATLGLVAIMFLVSRQVTQPVRALSDTMARISARDYDTDVPYADRKDEIGQMSVRLREFRDDLAFEAEERRERVAKDRQVITLFDELCSCLSQAAKGDIDVRIDISEFDGLADQHLTVCSNFNALVDSLSEMLETINLAAETVRVNALEISQVATDQSQRSEAQAATLEESAAGLKDLTSSVRSTAEHASRADDEIHANRRQAEESGSVVARTVEAMKKIESSSSQITEIITVIDDIAFQTNLLALNAGVEAARAGEAGRGFAVVASEVRALAQRASDSANEIKELIVNSGQHVSEGGALVNQTGQALNNIIEGVAKVSEIVSSIATASRGQSDNLEEINNAVNELDKVTQQNAAIIEETSAASSSLSHEAERLTDALERYRSGGRLESQPTEEPDDTVEVLFRSHANRSNQDPGPVLRNTHTGTTDQDGWQDF